MGKRAAATWSLNKIKKIWDGLKSNKDAIKKVEGQIKTLSKKSTTDKKFAGFSNPKKLNTAKKKLTKLKAVDKKRINILKKGGYAAAGTTAAALTLDTLLDKVLKDKGTTPSVKNKASSITIKKGDTLSQIAKANGTTLKALQEANPDIKDLNKIRIGQKINLSPKVKDRKSVYQGMSKSEMASISKDKVVSRKHGGQIGAPRGVGAALRGYGKGYK
jgi:LysM repeat protein